MLRALVGSNGRYAAGAKVSASRAVGLDKACDAASRRDAHDGHAIDDGSAGLPVRPSHDANASRVSLETDDRRGERVEPSQ